MFLDNIIKAMELAPFYFGFILFMVITPIVLLAYLWVNREKRKKDIYQMGYVFKPRDGITRARKNLTTGDVEMVLWKAGEQGHKNDFWIKFGDGWEKYFIGDIEYIQ